MISRSSLYTSPELLGYMETLPLSLRLLIHPYLSTHQLYLRQKTLLSYPLADEPCARYPRHLLTLSVLQITPSFSKLLHLLGSL